MVLRGAALLEATLTSVSLIGANLIEANLVGADLIHASESTGTTKETVARRLLRSREGDIQHEIPVNPKTDRVTFEDAAKDLLNDYEANKRRSLDSVKRRVRLHLGPFCNGRRLSSIGAADARAYVAKRQQDVIVTARAMARNVGRSRTRKSTTNSRR